MKTGRTVHIIIAVLFTLFLSGHFLINNQKIQQEVAQRIVHIIENTLHTNVDASSISMVYPCGLIINNLVLLDQQNDTLASFGSISMRIKMLPLIHGKLSITSARIVRPQINLSKEGVDGQLNYAFITDRFHNNGNSGIKLRINSIIIKDGSISYNIKSAPSTPGVFNRDHIKIDGLSTKLSLKNLDCDSLNLIVRRLDLTESSGLTISRSKGNVIIGSTNSQLNGFQLNSRNSRIAINNISIGFGLHGKEEISPKISIDINATVKGSDFMAIYPAFSSMNDRLSFRFKADGNIRHLNISSVSLQSSDKEIYVHGNGIIENPTTPDSLSISNGHIHCSVSSELTDYLNRQLSGLGIVMPERLRALGVGIIQAEANGSMHNLSIISSIRSDGGNADVTITTDGPKQSAKIICNNLNLRAITNNNDFRRCNITLKADRIFSDSSHFSGRFSSVINGLYYKQYRYSNIGIDGTFNQQSITAALKLSDTNADIDLNAFYSTADNNNTINLSLDASDINLKSLNLITNTDSATISGNITAHLSGHNIDDMLGNLQLSNIEYNNHNGSFQLRELTLTAGDVGNDLKIISILSDFLNMSIIGDYKTSSISSSMMRIFNQSLPALHDWIIYRTGFDNIFADTACNNFLIDIRLLKTDFFSKVLDLPMYYNNTATLQCYVNDCDSTATLELSIPNLTYGNEHIESSLLSVESRRGIGSLSIRSTHNSIGGDKTDFCTLMTAFGNKVTGLFSWDSMKEGEFSGSILGTVDFKQFDKKNNWLVSSYHFDRSQLTINNVEWELSPSVIVIDSGKINISDFGISHDSQYIRADGIISSDSTDMMNVELNQIDIDQMLSMLRINKLYFKGIASGQFNASSLLSSPVFLGNINVDNFGFYNTDYGTLSLNGSWNDEMQHIDITADIKDNDSKSTLISGYYDTSNKCIDFDIDAEHTDLYFLNLFLGNVFKEVRGNALGSLRIYGPLKQLNLTGQAILENGYLYQGNVNTAFIIKSDTLRFEPDRMIFNNLEFYDEEGHDGILNCIVSHHNLHEFAVNMDASFANMQILNLQESDKSSINAKVFAEGSMALEYSKRYGLKISADARTAARTSISYELSPKSISETYFLKVVNGSEYTTNTTDSVPTVSPAPSGSGRLQLNINLECTEDADIRLAMNSLSGSINGYGNIQAIYNSSDGITLNGVYNISHGQFVLSLENFISKNFSLLDGSFVRFTGSPSETELNVHTYHAVNSVSIHDLDASASTTNNVRVRCLMDITGQVNTPTLSFGIDMPYGTSEDRDILASATSTEEQRNMQFMYLLAIGKFYTYDYSDAENVNGLSPNAMESILNTTVNAQINNILSQILNNNVLSLSSNVSAGGYLYGNSTNMTNKELEGILEARLLNNRLLFNGNFGYRENALTNTSNFIGDFEVRWLLFPKHGISLKGYSKNNDRYFSKTTLTTQGVGVVYEKDFDRLLPERKTRKSDNQ